LSAENRAEAKNKIQKFFCLSLPTGFFISQRKPLAEKMKKLFGKILDTNKKKRKY
jgi:hypothetical protein